MTERTYHIVTNLAALRMAKLILRDAFICEELCPVKPELQEKLREAFRTIDELTDVYHKASRR